MKTNRIKTKIHNTDGRPSLSLLRACLDGCSAIRDGIKNAKETILWQYGPGFEGCERLLKLALNEAEAVAWQTEYPHLVFPELALEKTRAAVSWQRRQKAIQGNLDSAFAA